MTDHQPADMPDWQALRDQIADALLAEHLRRAEARIAASPEDHSAAMAAAVMAVVQPEMDALQQRAEQAEAALARVRKLTEPPRVILRDNGGAVLNHGISRSRIRAALDGTGPKDQP